MLRHTIKNLNLFPDNAGKKNRNRNRHRNRYRKYRLRSRLTTTITNIDNFLSMLAPKRLNLAMN